MADKTKVKKGLPKRTGKKKANGYSVKCKANTAKRKLARISSLKSAHSRNVKILAEGGLTAWQEAKERRAAARAKDPEVQKRKRAFLELQELI